jgi:hypothetical protein
MNTTTNSLVQKLWNYCNVLRDDGMSYGDYVEQLTYLLFLKMADERSAPPYNQPSIVPAAYAWPTLLARDGDELFDHYRHLLEKLGQEKGTLGLIFGKAQNKFQDPAKLRRVIVDLIDAENLDHSGCRREGRRLRGPAGEKRARHQERRGPVLHAARAHSRPWWTASPRSRASAVTDPACGTGGFLFTAHNYITAHNKSLTREQLKHLKEKAFTGYELVQGTARVCAMNMMLHGIGSEKRCPWWWATRWPPTPASALRWCWPTRRLARKAAPSSWAKTAAPAPRKTPSSATTSGPPPATSSSTLCSTSRPCWPPMAARRWCCPTTCCLKAARAKPSARSCCTSAMCTRYCACPPACFTPRA